MDNNSCEEARTVHSEGTLVVGCSNKQIEGVFNALMQLR